MAVSLIEEWAKLDKIIKEKEKDLKKLKKDRNDMTEPVLELFAQMGVTSVKTIHGPTIYIHNQTWANARKDENEVRDFESACGALVQAGYPEFVETKFNVMKVSSLIRELDAKGEITPELYEALDIAERTSVRARG